MEATLKNHARIQLLCHEHEEATKTIDTPVASEESKEAPPTSSSIGSNIALIGNRIDIQGETLLNGHFCGEHN